MISLTLWLALQDVTGTCELYVADETAKEKPITLHTLPGSSSAFVGVHVVNGQAFGTLSKEARKRVQRKRAQSRKEVACLASGDWFGGGWSILGEGKRQASLRVVSKTPIEAFVLPVEDLLTYTDLEIVRFVLFAAKGMPTVNFRRRLREDASFRLTYYFGRRGLLDVHSVIGHPTVGMLASAAYQSKLSLHKRNQKIEQQLKQDTVHTCNSSVACKAFGD